MKHTSKQNINLSDWNYRLSCPWQSQAIIDISWFQLSFCYYSSIFHTGPEGTLKSPLSHHAQSWNPVLLQAGTSHILSGLEESLLWEQSPILTVFYSFTNEGAPGAFLFPRFVLASLSHTSYPHIEAFLFYLKRLFIIIVFP